MDYKKGQKVKVILYRGSNHNEAWPIIVSLQHAKDMKRPMPLLNTEFNIAILEVKTNEIPDVMRGIIYEVEVEGELI